MLIGIPGADEMVVANRGKRIAQRLIAVAQNGIQSLGRALEEKGR
jgi:hypothetical protein